MNDTFVLVSHREQPFNSNRSMPVRCKGSITNEIFDMTIVNRLDTFTLSAWGYPYLHLLNKADSIQATIFDSSVSSGQCSGYDSRLCLKSISSLTVGANTFNEVYQIETPILDQNGSELFTCDMFWVKNVGIVKVIRNDSNSTTFNLISWSVVQ